MAVRAFWVTSPIREGRNRLGVAVEFSRHVVKRSHQFRAVVGRECLRKRTYFPIERGLQVRGEECHP